MSRPLTAHAGRALVVVVVAGAVALGARPLPAPRATPLGDEPPLVAVVRARDGVEIDALVWAAGGGAARTVGDALAARTFVAEGRARGEGRRDVWVGHARLGPSGAPLWLSPLFNLTDTADADEHDLRAAGDCAAFLTSFNGKVTGVTVLDLRGDQRPPREPWWVSLQRDVENVVHTGSSAGLGVRRFFFDHAVARADLALVPGPGETAGEGGAGAAWAAPAAAAAGGGAAVEVRYHSVADGPERVARIDPASGAVTGDGGAALAARPLPAPDDDWVAWSVNTARDVPWIGPERIDLAKQVFFAALDGWKRFSYRPGSADEGGAEEAPTVGAGPAAPLAPLAAGASPLDGPPPAVPPLPGTGRKGEGTWEPLAFPVALPGAPPAFWSTVYRPDPERPFAWVRLVAMDPRQLDLHMVGGTEHPRSPTGFADTGVVPAAPAVRARLAAAFSGGFQAIHGGYGMITERGVLLPPKAGAATVAVARDGTIRLGSWPAAPASGAAGAAPRGAAVPPGATGPASASASAPAAAPVPEFLVAVRQNLPPLLMDGVVNPTRRRTWGFTVDKEDPVYTWRSALGATADGRLVFGVGPSLSAETLAAAMKGAGCTWAMHLDMNISNIHFELFRPAGAGPKVPPGPGVHLGHVPPRPGHPEDLTDAVTLTTAMWLTGFPRYLTPHERDFFYVTLREVLPPPDLGAAAGDAAARAAGAGHWETTDVPAGRETWPPLAARTWVAPDPARPAERVDVLLLDGGALELEVAPEGPVAAEDGEAGPGGAAGTAVLEWVGRGLTADAPFGARLGAALRKPPLGGAATLAVGADGAPRIGRWGVDLDPAAVTGPFVQGPSLVEDGKLLDSYASWWEPRARWAVGVTAAGRLLLALGRVASDRSMAEALQRAGAVTALDLSAGEGPSLRLAGVRPGWLPTWAVPGGERGGADAVVSAPVEAAGTRATIRLLMAPLRRRVVVGDLFAPSAAAP
ncbi:MAG TPA: phosphodiester glycosidase family protein [Myxococcota bacterium]|jgi:hypothetical protein|nr:phosphodiester glycosidase family protein [Myxococcota bacterium]